MPHGILLLLLSALIFVLGVRGTYKLLPPFKGNVK